MHRIFQRFIDRLAISADAGDFRDAMTEACSALELRCFAYLAFPLKPDQQPQLISTYPLAWTTHYLQNHYERLDPIVSQMLASPEPFRWGLGTEAKELERPQKDLLSDAAQFGIRYGFTIPIHDGHGPIAGLTFAADEPGGGLQHGSEQHARVLQLMAMYFHAHIRRKFAPARTVDGVILSPREVECLEWAAQGKSAWETGRILGISRHTTAFHLNNAKMKLGVRTTIQAVARLTASMSTMK